MAASDRNKKGKRTDYCKHFSNEFGGLPVCKQENYGYSTPDIGEVDCEKCIKKLTPN